MRRRVGGLVGLATVAVALGGCLPTPATQEARAIAELYTVLMAIAAIVALIVVGLATFMILRYRGGAATTRCRRRTTATSASRRCGRSSRCITIVGLLVLTVVTLQRVDAVVDDGSASVKVDVQAFRWGWRFAYPAQGIVVEGVTPDRAGAGRPGRRSGAGDADRQRRRPRVLRAAVPVQARRDPGSPERLRFTVETAGTYRGQCAEFCGVGHSRMPFTVRAVPRAEYDAWLAAAPRGSTAP